jgi:hypothetical protein
MRCEVQSTVSPRARAVWALLSLLTLAQLAAPVWALYGCDYLNIVLSSDLVDAGYTLQVMHQTHARHQSACGACACATCPRHVGTAHSKLGRHGTRPGWDAGAKPASSQPGRPN